MSALPDAATPTPRQLEVLRAIHGEIVRNGWPPTIRELGRLLGIGSTNGVNDHLKALERRGWLVRGGVARGLRITDGGAQWLGGARS